MQNLLTPLWQPSVAEQSETRAHDFILRLSARDDSDVSSYHELYQWSIDHLEQFWSLLWDWAGVVGEKGERVLEHADDIERAEWFPDAKINYAENLLRDFAEQCADDIALYFRAEDFVEYTLTYRELRNQVFAMATWLREHGIGRGDRVAGYLPNMPETIVAYLATASIGAIWTSTSPDFGAESVIERFGQTKPRVLLSVDGYFYNGKRIEMVEKVEAVCVAIPSIEYVIEIPLLSRADGAPQQLRKSTTAWQTVIETSVHSEVAYTRVGFNDPLCILYSSGTTGKPKCIVHRVGGVLLQHIKEHQLHTDVRSGDKLFYFTTCGWMMWNWLVSGLASGASLVLYDGSPFAPHKSILWDYADAVGVTQFGTSAKYIDAMKKHAVHPRESHSLETIRTICSTGSVLSPESFEFVYAHIKSDVCLASISGGTDIVSCFLLGSPMLPVYAGECQTRGLGMAVEVFDETGCAVQGQKGELVCTKPFPSQPAGFWNDSDGEKYHQAYFSVYDNVWRHGDYIELTEHQGVIVYGRSDATLNPGGVRIGTAEIYRYVEQLPEVIESIVIGQDWQGDVRVVLFVVLATGVVLDNALKARIREAIKQNCTPRHVPGRIIAVSEIPRTKSGKIVELAVREVVHGREVKNQHALVNPEALEFYRDLPDLQN